MKRHIALPLFALAACIPAMGTPCTTAPLTTYLNGGALFSCSESSGLNIVFNNTILPSYVGLNLLTANNSAANPAAITTTPDSAGLYFMSSAFAQSPGVLSSQSELVHFSVLSAGTTITSTTFSLTDAATSAGFLGLGTGLAIGQELVCIGGSFTSLPVGLVTTVANGVLGTGTYGCSGAVVVGTTCGIQSVENGQIRYLRNVGGRVESRVRSGKTDRDLIRIIPPLSIAVDRSAEDR